MRERVWRYRSVPWIEDLWRDIRSVLRSLARTPGFTAIAIVVIAVGVGANTAVFSVINTVLLKPLSYPDPQSLVQLLNSSPQGSFAPANVPNFALWRDQTSVFQDVAAYDLGGSGLNLTGGDNPTQVQGIYVTADYFRLFGAPMVAGRSFTAAEDSPNGGDVAVLSYGLWQRRFGGNANIVGSSIQLNGKPHLVVGIVDRSFVTEPPGDLWLPYQFDLASQDMAHYFRVAARLKRGITPQVANAQLKLAADQFRRTYPDALGPQSGFKVISLQEAMVGGTRSSLLVLLGAVALVLLIACANVANLLLIRASARTREFATRSALGAGRGHIIRQLITESLVLSFAGGFLGLIIGLVGVRLLLAINAGGIPRIGENGSAVTLDLRVLLFTFSVSLVTGIVFGLFPAVRVSRRNLLSALNESSNRAGTGFRSGRIRSLLVISEMAFALILLIGASLLIRTFLKLQAVDPGFDGHNVLTMAMSTTGDRFQTSANVAQLVRDGTERLKAIPGVTSAAAACGLPLQGLEFHSISSAAPKAANLQRVQADSSRYRGVTLKRSRRRWCEAAHSPSMTMAPHPGSSSSTKRWPNSTGRRRIRSKTCSLSGRDLIPSSTSRRDVLSEWWPTCTTTT